MKKMLLIFTLIVFTGLISSANASPAGHNGMHHNTAHPTAGIQMRGNAHITAGHMHNHPPVRVHRNVYYMGYPAPIAWNCPYYYDYRFGRCNYYYPYYNAGFHNKGFYVNVGIPMF